MNLYSVLKTDVRTLTIRQWACLVWDQLIRDRQAETRHLSGDEISIWRTLRLRSSCWHQLLIVQLRTCQLFGNFRGTNHDPQSTSSLTVKDVNKYSSAGGIVSVAHASTDRGLYNEGTAVKSWSSAARGRSVLSVKIVSSRSAAHCWLIGESQTSVTSSLGPATAAARQPMKLSVIRAGTSRNSAVRAVRWRTCIKHGSLATPWTFIACAMGYDGGRDAIRLRIGSYPYNGRPQSKVVP